MKVSEKTLTTAVAAVAAAALITGTVAMNHGEGHTDPPQPAAADGVRGGDTAVPAAAPGGDPAGAAELPPSTPLSVRIPAISVDAPLAGYGLEPSGSPEVPPEDRTNLAAWYRGGVSPGSPGTSLITGHVDNSTGPAVFYDLGALQRGDTVEVDRADGRTAVFTVTAVDVFDRDDFPDDLVYGQSAGPELRLITCGGPFSRSAGGYLGNVVAFARLTGTR
ncbi:class F sortase [Streptomyces spiramenti]|uniref:Class F sortase n=1 Tax=Streptomyces spiramenti TaxID=2720606 RepID=A0ABX1ASN7_9ACTN|nr:class F sortase [Streptomyces spiramenti]NJP68741.1 class F sortase [Streptomyces spiramenti]